MTFEELSALALAYDVAVTNAQNQSDLVEIANAIVTDTRKSLNEGLKEYGVVSDVTIPLVAGTALYCDMNARGLRAATKVFVLAASAA